MRIPLALSLCGLLLLPAAAAFAAPEESPAPWADEARALLDGVRETAAPGVPGTVAVWGGKAFPVVVGGAGGQLRAPVVAAARWGNARVVALSHDGYGDPGAAAVADTGRLLQNAVAWAAGPAKAPRVGVRGSRLAPWLASRGVDAKALDAEGWATRLDDLEVLCLFTPNLSPKEEEAVGAFLRRGRGLVAAQTGWGWLQVRRKDDLRENALQRLVAPAGLGWTASTAERTSGRGFSAGDAPGRPLHAAHAVDALAAAATEGGGRRDLRQASHTAIEAWRVLPADEQDLRGRVRRLLRGRAGGLVPTDRAPLGADRALDRFLLAVQVEEAARLEPEKVAAHPAAASFPGAVPSGARAETARLDLDLAVPGWRSTGRYARPGEVVRASLAAATGGPKTAEGLALRIGCHTDALWGLDAWKRVPEITLARPFADGQAVAASPFGGLVYLVVPPGRSGTASVEVEGAVAAPRFVLGRTSAEAWREARKAPGPWAEFETSKVVLTVPSDRVRGLDDPRLLMLWWDRVLDAQADLAGIPRERERPERIVADLQISAGYMHSGYPIMTHLDAAERMVDLPRLATKGDWGLFHELGHNHQSGDWTFEGTGEVTVNLFTLYVYDTVVGKGDEPAHDAFRRRDAATRAHLAKGAPFDGWKADPFLALFSYAGPIEAFGWEPVKAAFAEYRALPAAERPKSDAEKRDQWLVRFSRKVGRDLGPWFEAWGIPVSPQARAATKALPAWMPERWPP